MKPPDLSLASTVNSMSFCMQRRETKVAASWPYGSDFSDGLRAVRGARMPERTSVILVSCFGMKIWTDI